MDASDRGLLLHRLADLMERDANYLAVSNLDFKVERMIIIVFDHNSSHSIASKQIFVGSKNVCLI